MKNWIWERPIECGVWSRVPGRERRSGFHRSHRWIQRGQNFLGLAIVALTCALVSPPADAENDILKTAVVLIAAPGLMDAEYRQTVLLATATDNGGHVGIILNRPTQRSLASLFPEHGPSKKVVEPVFFGGPFGITALTAAVHTYASPGPGSITLMPGVFLAVGVQTIDRIIEERPNDARYYIGHVGWRPGELRHELDRGLWYVTNANADIVFRKDMDGLWEDLVRAARQVSAALDPAFTH